MNILKARRARYYLRLAYAVRVVACARGFVGRYPDLPGCEAFDTDLQRLYGSLDMARRDWIMRRTDAGHPVPMPNSHAAGLAPPGERRGHRRRPTKEIAPPV